MTVMPPDDSLPAVGDRYVLVDRLGGDEGREVWRGHDDLAGRRVVVTIYHPADEAWRTGFDRRARQLEVLADPGIASTLAHDSGADDPWLVTSFVEGATAAEIAADPGLTTDDALAIIGQAALALGTAHGAGVGHGGLSTSRIQVRPDGSVALLDFAIDRSPSPADDIAALRRIAHELLDGTADAAGAAVASFVRLLDAGDWDDPADIGRTALALAAAQRVNEPTSLVPPPATPEPEAETPRPWYDEDERKRVRNRLIALGAIVVLGGAALLRIFSSGAGQTSVPSVIGESYVQAQHELNEIGLRTSETITTGPTGSEGTVLAQSPHGGQRVKVGSVVSLTVAAVRP
jgi:serine/threonine-protein kinase